MGTQQSKNSIEITPYDLFQAIRNESDKKIIRLIKNNPEVAPLALSFATAKDISNTGVDNQDMCNCSYELERCLPTAFCSTEEMISRFENCLKTGRCPHVVPLEHNVASRTVSGFYWIHLAIILNKFTLFKELTPLFFMSMNKSNMNWFTVDNGYSVLYLLLVHNRSHMLLSIIKHIDKYEIKGEGSLADNAGYYEAIKMNNVDVLRPIVHTNRMNDAATKGFDLAFESRSYESLDFLVDYHGHPWRKSSMDKLESAIMTGDVRLTRLMMNAYWKQGCPKSQLWYTIQDLLAKKVLDRDLPIAQAIFDTRRKINVAFEKHLLRTTFHGYPLIKWATELEMSTEMRQFLIEAGFTPGDTSKISEEHASIISLIIDNRKWAYQDVKCLIRKGHDANKCDQNGSDIDHLGNLPFNVDDIRTCLARQILPPFHVALRSRRYDIAKLLLLNGAQPLPTNSVNLGDFIHEHFRGETLYLLITCNSLLSVPVGRETLLRHLLYSRESGYPGFTDHSSIYFLFKYGNSSYPNMHYDDLILLILDKIDIFCYEDRKALLDYQNDKSLPNVILEKIHTILYEPNSLMNICRKRLHSHYKCHFHRFICLILDEAYPKYITDYLQCKDLLLKYSRPEDIAAGDNRLAGIS